MIVEDTIETTKLVQGLARTWRAEVEGLDLRPLTLRLM